MERIIPKETIKFIEGKLHSRDKIQQEIDDWRLSVKYPANRQLVPNAGYISDPTANLAIKFADPPPRIRECEKWVELIDQTMEYCRQNKNRVFEIWYGKKRQTAMQAHTKSGMRKNTFYQNRCSAVSYLLFRAIDAGLCKLDGN